MVSEVEEQSRRNEWGKLDAMSREHEEWKKASEIGEMILWWRETG